MERSDNNRPSTSDMTSPQRHEPYPQWRTITSPLPDLEDLLGNSSNLLPQVSYPSNIQWQNTTSFQDMQYPYRFDQTPTHWHTSSSIHNQFLPMQASYPPAQDWSRSEYDIMPNTLSSLFAGHFEVYPPIRVNLRAQAENMDSFRSEATQATTSAQSEQLFWSTNPPGQLLETPTPGTETHHRIFWLSSLSPSEARQTQESPTVAQVEPLLENTLPDEPLCLVKNQTPCLLTPQNLVKPSPALLLQTSSPFCVDTPSPEPPRSPSPLYSQISGPSQSPVYLGIPMPDLNYPFDNIIPPESQPPLSYSTVSQTLPPSPPSVSHPSPTAPRISSLPRTVLEPPLEQPTGLPLPPNPPRQESQATPFSFLLPPAPAPPLSTTPESASSPSVSSTEASGRITQPVYCVSATSFYFPHNITDNAHATDANAFHGSYAPNATVLYSNGGQENNAEEENYAETGDDEDNYLKCHAARNNTSPPFTANKMLVLLQEAINNVQPEDRSKVVNKTKMDIMSYWDRDIHIGNIMESSLIISVTDSDDEFSDNSDVPDSDMSSDE